MEGGRWKEKDGSEKMERDLTLFLYFFVIIYVISNTFSSSSKLLDVNTDLLNQLSVLSGLYECI